MCSAACAPDQLFLPLLAEALDQGVNPNLGRSTKLARSAIAQHASSKSVEPVAGGQALDQIGPVAPHYESVQAGSRALRQEEVLMFHRAASRLGEMCQVVESGG